VGGEAGPGEGVVLAFGGEVPAEHDHLAGDGDHRDLDASPLADPSIERSERSRRAGRGEGRFDDHAAGLGAAGLGDPPVDGGAVAGLADPGVQAEIGHEAVGVGEAREVADGGEQRHGDGDINAGHGHEPGGGGVVDRLEGDVPIDGGQFGAVEVQLADQRLYAALLIGGQGLVGEPPSTHPGEQVGVRAGGHQVAGQDGVDLVLQPGPLTDQVRAAHHDPAKHSRPVIGDPGLRQEVRGQQLGQDAGVDLVGLDLRLGDGPGLARVRHHHPSDQRPQHRGDGVAVRRGLQHDLIVGAQRAGPGPQVFRLHPDASLVAAQPLLDDGELRERPMHIHPDRSHTPAPLRLLISRNHRAETTETDTRSQRNRASRRGGQVLTRARSSLYRSACPS